MDAISQGDLRLLETDQAKELLASSIPARVAMIWSDGTPRVVPTWFHWTGSELVMPTYVAGPEAGIRHAAKRVEVLRANPAVAIVIDTETMPPTSLTIRGTAVIDEVDGLAPEYIIEAAGRYLGEEGAAGLVEAMDKPGTRQARIVVKPDWVGLVDFQTRLPSVQGGVQ